MKNYTPKTDDELKQLSMDLANGKIFTNRHLPEHDKTSLGMIFMPLVLGAFKDRDEEDIKDIGLIYEYYDKAGPRSINGYPSFFSFGFLDTNDCNRMHAYYTEYIALKDKFQRSSPVS